MRSLQILVVEDEPAIRQVVSAQLKKAGHTVEQAGDAEAALERLARGDIDIALSDIKLPYRRYARHSYSSRFNVCKTGGIFGQAFGMAGQGI